MRGIICHVLGIDGLHRRASALATRYDNVDPADPWTFLDSYYRENQQRPLIPLIHNAVAFSAPSTSAGLSHTYSSDSGRQWYILDVRTDAFGLSRIIPLGSPNHAPFSHASWSRAHALYSDIEPVPFWVVSSVTGLGIPVTERNPIALQHGDKVMLKTGVCLRIEVNAPSSPWSYLINSCCSVAWL